MRRTYRGQIIPLLALLLVPLLAFTALGTDAAYLYTQRRVSQNAADAAALAAARELLRRTADDSQIRGTARLFAQRNGVTDPIPDNAISIERPDNVRVVIHREITPFFLPVLGVRTLQVGARARAQITQAPGEYALLALEDLITNPGIYANGTTNIKVLGRGPSGRGASVRTNAAIDSRGTVTFIVDGYIDAAGCIRQNGTWQYDCLNANLGDFVPDPLAGKVRPPTYSDLRYEYRRDCNNYTGPLECRPLPTCDNEVELKPGLYRNLRLPRDLPRSGNRGGPCTRARTIRFVPDNSTPPALPVVILENTTLELRNTRSRLETRGILLYVTGPSGLLDPKNGEISLTAPTSLPYPGGIAGMAVWIANCSVFDSRGNGEFSIKGIFYAPCSSVSMHGNPNGVAVEGQVIVKDLTIKGTSDFIVNYHHYVDTYRNTVVLLPNNANSE